MCVGISTCTCVHLYMFMLGPAVDIRSFSSVILHLPFWDRVPRWTLSLLLAKLVSHFRDLPICLPVIRSGLQMSCGNPNPNPHAYTASMLFTEPPPLYSGSLFRQNWNSAADFHHICLLCIEMFSALSFSYKYDDWPSYWQVFYGLSIVPSSKASNTPSLSLLI